MPRARPHPKPAPSGERALIDRIRVRAASFPGSRALKLGIGDDCAILHPPAGQDLLVTTDFCLENRHFRRDTHSPHSTGHRTLTRGLSDLAAMGGRPLAVFLSLALPRSIARDTAWLDGFLDGLLTLAAEHNVPLAGGDTSESPTDHILADILLLGAAPRSAALRRSTAQPGDLLYVTGSLGGAAAELSAALNGAKPRENPGAPRSSDRPMHAPGGPLSRVLGAKVGSKAATASSAKSAPTGHPHFFPSSRLLTGQALRKRRFATACIDLSDGLSTDLTHLCQASHVRAEIDAPKLPLHPLAKLLSPEAALTAALHGGEDYELLFTAPSSAKLPRTIAGVPVTGIGRILPPRRHHPQVILVHADGTRKPISPQGWEHLK